MGAQTGVLGRLQTVVAAAKIPGPECAKIIAAMAGPARPAGSFNLTQETLSWWRQGRGWKGREWASAEGGRPCVDDSHPCEVSRYVMGTGPRWGLALETA